MAKRGLLGVASAIAFVSLLSKGVGFGRELVIAAVFGASAARDAYTAAYIIPAFALVMLGGLTGPFHTATQKVITTLRQRGEDDQLPSVVATVLLTVLGVMGLLSVLTYVLAPGAIWLVASQAKPEVASLAVAQLRLMSPLILIGGLVGVFCGISNDRGDYTLPSLSPMVASLSVMVLVLARPEPLSLALGTLAGGVGQFLLQAPAAWKLLAGAGRLRFVPAHAEVKGLWWLLVPAGISSTVGMLNVIIGTNFASALAVGSISIFNYANLLIQLPLGILMTALLIPLFPLLTQAVVADDRPSLFSWLQKGLSTVALATLPLIALFVAAGEPIVALMFQRGAFTRADTHETYLVLSFIALGIFTYAARDLMIRVFFALGDSRTPLMVSLASMAVTAGLMALTIGPFGLLGLAASTAAVTAVNCGLIAFLLHRKLGELPLGTFGPLFVKSLAAAVIGGLAAWELGVLLPPALSLDAGPVAILLRAGVQATALGLVFSAVLALLGLPVKEGLLTISQKVRRRPAK